jgi:hypothetical protein
MFALATGASQRAFRAVLAAVLVLFLFSTFSVSDAAAQGRRTGHVLHHDSSNPPPGHQKGKGKGHGKSPAFSMFSPSGSITSPTVQIAATRAVVGVRAILRDQALMTASGVLLSADVQSRLHGLFDGTSDGAIPGLLTALEGPENGDAAAEAARLVTLLAALPDAPETFPATALAYNKFIDESSDAFVLDPPEELLAIRAVLFTVLEPTLRAVEDDAVEDEDDDEALRQRVF